MAEETKWYSLRVISGKEKKIRERLVAEITRSGWLEIVTQVIVPSEKVYKIRNGKKVIVQWMETVVVVKENKKWKIKVLHSTLIKRSCNYSVLKLPNLL